MLGILDVLEIEQMSKAGNEPDKRQRTSACLGHTSNSKPVHGVL